MVSAACRVYGNPFFYPPESVVIGNRNGSIPVSISQTGFQTAQPRQEVGTVCSLFLCTSYDRVNDLEQKGSTFRHLLSVGVTKTWAIISGFHITHGIINFPNPFDECFDIPRVEGMKLLH